MKVLMSIQPKWCELISSGKKTVEVRKTKPKLEVPFKVYIYCTRPPRGRANMYNAFGFGGYAIEYGGKVIGEFVCNRIDKIFQCNSGWVQEHACISREEYFNYLGLPYNSHFDAKGAFAWHITDLIIYDEPRELGEFWTAGQCLYASTEGCTYNYPCYRAGQRCCHTITRPPQSWCYVEEVKSNER